MKRYKILLSLLCVVVFVFLAVGSTGNDEEPAAEPEEVVEEPADEAAEDPEGVDEIAIFRDDILWNQEEIGFELTGLGDHLANYDGSEGWYIGTESYIYEIRWLINDAEDNIVPPPEKQEHYNIYMEALQYIRESMNLLEEWMDTGNDEKLDELGEYMDMAEERIDEFQRMMDE